MTSPSPTEAKPYKGPESYQLEDSDLFFGRDREADQLIAKILSSRLTLLHAQSGAGKTSLLNARIIPGLESRGWSACRILPQNDPIQSVRATTLKYVLPPPPAELMAIQRARERLGASEELTLDDLLKRYDDLPVRDPLKRALVAPIQVATDDDPDGELFSPYFCRLLRSTIEVDSFVEHLYAILQGDSEGLLAHPITSETKIIEVDRVISAPAYSTAYRHLLRDLDVPVSELSVFFEHLVETYGRWRTRFTLVLVLDQFEEMFTRFIDPGPTLDTKAEMPDWRLRWEFFDQLKNLYEYESEAPSAKGTDSANAPTGLPIRYVISMRDEYIAQLDPIRRFVGTLDDSSYHLSLLEKNQAKAAIQSPATLFGYSYSSECYEKIIGQLTKEDRYVEPAHLQLVCEKLWNEKGRDLALSSTGPTRPSQKEIELGVFDKLKGTKGILSSFFDDFLKDFDPASRAEILELLEPLVTSGGTRNILEREVLINAPFRDAARRNHLLAELVNHTIVRTERRLGGYFIEITHEFLIAPVLDAIRKESLDNEEYSGLRWVLRTLEQFQGVSFGSGSARLLSRPELLALHQHRDRIKWNSWASELMLRSALSLRTEREVLDVWLKMFETYDQTLDAASVIAGKDVRRQDTLLCLAELRVVNGQRSGLELSAEQACLILRSELVWALDHEREDLVYWARKLKSYVEKPA
jgi:hypothetical protein